MTAVTVTYSNLFSQSWQNVYDLINNKTNVVDPTTSSSEFRKWIYTREPDGKSLDFADFPFIVIYPGSVNSGVGRMSLKGNARMVTFRFDIDVITSDREFNNREGRGATDCDNLSDDIIQTLNNLTNRNTLSGNNLFNVDVEGGSPVIEPFKEVLTYRRTFSVSLSTRMKVSA